MESWYHTGPAESTLGGWYYLPTSGSWPPTWRSRSGIFPRSRCPVKWTQSGICGRCANSREGAALGRVRRWARRLHRAAPRDGGRPHRGGRCSCQQSLDRLTGFSHSIFITRSWIDWAFTYARQQSLKYLTGLPYARDRFGSRPALQPPTVKQEPVNAAADEGPV